MSEFKAELKDVRQAIEELQKNEKHRLGWEERMASALQQAEASPRETHRRLSAELERMGREVLGRHVRLDEEVRLALRDAKDLLETELARFKEEQQRLREACAAKDAVEAEHTAIRREVARVMREDQSRYSQHSELLELQVKELESKIDKEGARMAEEQQKHLQELTEKLETALQTADAGRRNDMARLSSEHHTRHDDLHHALKTSSQELKRRIADEIGKCFDAHHKDYRDLRAKFDDSLEELEVKIAEVEALYSEAAEKRREAFALSYKFSAK